MLALQTRHRKPRLFTYRLQLVSTQVQHSMCPSQVSCCARQGHRTHCCQQGTRWPPLSEGLANIDVTSETTVISGLVVTGHPSDETQDVLFLLFGFSGTPVSVNALGSNQYPGLMTLLGGVWSHHKHRTTQIRSTGYIPKIRPHTLLQSLTQMVPKVEEAVRTSDIDGLSRHWEA